MKNQSVSKLTSNGCRQPLRCLSLGVVVLFGLLVPARAAVGQSHSIARVQYFGGDYYTDPTSLPNLVAFMNENTPQKWQLHDAAVSLLEPGLNRHKVLYLTGHGNLVLKNDEIEALRNYLAKGGFLLVNDNGPARSGNSIDEAFRREIARVFPEHQLLELPANHPVFEAYYSFPDGLPQIHRHDETQPPRAFGIFVDGRMVVCYVWNSDIGNGWEDQTVHNTPDDKHQAALQMGANLLVWALYQ